jgi:hypothetical protein
LILSGDAGGESRRLATGEITKSAISSANRSPDEVHSDLAGKIAFGLSGPPSPQNQIQSKLAPANL